MSAFGIFFDTTFGRNIKSALGTFWDTTFGRKGLVGEGGEMLGLWESGTTADRRRRERQRLEGYREDVEGRKKDINRRFDILSRLQSRQYTTQRRMQEEDYSSRMTTGKLERDEMRRRSGLSVGSSLSQSMADKFSRSVGLEGMRMLGMWNEQNMFDLEEQKRRETYSIEDALFSIDTQIRNF